MQHKNNKNRMNQWLEMLDQKSGPSEDDLISISVLPSKYNEYASPRYNKGFTKNENWFRAKLDLFPEWTELQTEQKPANLHEYVFPMFHFFHAVFLSPYYIKYDRMSQKCVKSSPSLLRKIICGIVHICVLAQLFGDIRTTKAEAVARAKETFVARLMYALFIIYHGSLFYTIWQIDGVTHLLNRIHDLSAQFKPCNCIVASKVKIKFLGWMWILSYLIFAILYWVFMNYIPWVDIIVDSRYGIANALNDSAHFEINLMKSIIFYPGVRLDERYHLSDHTIYTVGFILPIASFYISLTWIFNNLVLVFWGNCFKNFYEIYFSSMNKFKRDALKEITIFNRITCILTDFNAIYGVNILWGVVATVCFISNSIWSVFRLNGNRDVSVVGNALQLFSFGVYLAKLLVASQVNQKASEIVTRIKVHLKDEESWNKECVRTLEGIMIVFHDMQTHAIGFKGLNYFTVTFSFVGSVLSVIVTYAIVILQFNTEAAGTHNVTHENNTTLL